MKVVTTNLTIAQYCGQMQNHEIVVNHDYQRSSRVWPAPARSYLIDTILLGYPIPKLALYQKTDLRSRQTINEIVDGQQRSRAILAFFDDKLRITGKSDFAGKRYSQLDEPDQQRFIEYQLSLDIFTGATENEIRQVFRRINSYMVPLNPQEIRHATHQGAFKWFIVALIERYAQALKQIGVFSEPQLSRMNDGALFTEITLAMLSGIKTSRITLLKDLYESKDREFTEAKSLERRFDEVFGQILDWTDLHNGVLMKPYNFYSLFLAVTHCQRPLAPLAPAFTVTRTGLSDPDVVLANLSSLAAAAEGEVTDSQFANFVAANAEATNTERQRTVRFQWFCRAIQDQLG